MISGCVYYSSSSQELPQAMKKEQIGSTVVLSVCVLATAAIALIGLYPQWVGLSSSFSSLYAIIPGGIGGLMLVNVIVSSCLKNRKVREEEGVIGEKRGAKTIEEKVIGTVDAKIFNQFEKKMSYMPSFQEKPTRKVKISVMGNLIYYQETNTESGEIDKGKNQQRVSPAKVGCGQKQFPPALLGLVIRSKWEDEIDASVIAEQLGLEEETVSKARKAALEWGRESMRS